MILHEYQIKYTSFRKLYCLFFRRNNQVSIFYNQSIDSNLTFALKLQVTGTYVQQGIELAALQTISKIRFAKYFSFERIYLSKKLECESVYISGISHLKWFQNSVPAFLGHQKPIRGLINNHVKMNSMDHNQDISKKYQEFSKQHSALCLNLAWTKC